MNDVDLSRLKDLAALAAEDLHEDLVPYVYEGSWGRMLKHPLVFQVPVSINGLANIVYAQKTKRLAEVITEQDWHTYIFLHERPHRFDALVTVITEYGVTGEDVWALARDVWIDSENIWQHYDEWVELLSKEDAMLMMTNDELAEWNALPAFTTVYRGAKLELNEDGLSYTLSKERAEWFARRFAKTDEPSVIICGVVPSHTIVALLRGRGEDEVIVLPEHVVINYYEEIDL